MKTLIVQTDTAWESPRINRDSIAQTVRASEPADLIVLPEMFTTGFNMNPQASAEMDGTQTLEWMLALAEERRAAVAGSVAIEQGGRYFNRLYFAKPDGTHAAYDKRHLFTYAGEDRGYTPGERRIIVEHLGVRILLQICYDLRFPVFSRNRGDYDMILYSANWPQARIGVWNTLLRARAIENVCYVAGANRVGTDPDALYGGCSALIDFKGEPLAVASSENVKTISEYVDMEKLAEFRLKFPALADADKFSLKL